jgi:hypothetical protein
VSVSGLNPSEAVDRAAWPGARDRGSIARSAGAGNSLQTACATTFVFVIPFTLLFRLILFHFYVRGSFLYDTGLLASLMYHSGSALTLPPSLGGLSFFSYHAAPLLLLVSAASYHLPLSMPQLFASFIGLSHGLLALAMFWLLVSGYGMRHGRALALAAVTAIAFACNGLALDIARFPHFEIFAAASLLVFFVALVLQRLPIAIASFVLALATREDVGLHAFGFLTVWAALNWYRLVPWRQSAWIIGFALAGLAWSAAALLLQHHAFPGASAFLRVYPGDPPFAHLSADLVLTRVFGWLWLHVAIFAPAAATLVWAERARNPYIIAGYVACLPWAVLHLLAASPLAGWMVGYYAYPFLLAMAWPWLAVLIGNRQERAPVAGKLRPAGGLLAMVALSLLPLGHHYDPGRIDLPEAFLRVPSAARQAATEDGVSAIIAMRPALGRLVVDNSVAALRPLAFSQPEVAGWAHAPADTVVFFTAGFDAARLRDAPGMPGRYLVPGTELRIATNRPDSTMRELGFVREPP